LGQQLGEGRFGLRKVAAHPLGNDQQPTGEQARAVLLLGHLRQRQPGIGHRLGQAQPRPRLHRLVGQQRQPPYQLAFSAAEVLAQVLLAPAGRPTVQLRYQVRLELQEAGAEQVGEQVVEAPPAAFLVQGDEEQVGPLQLLELVDQGSYHAPAR
jgi:hypothetical protein